MKIYGEMIYISGDSNVPVKSFICLLCCFVEFNWESFQKHYFQSHGITLLTFDEVLIVPFANHRYLIYGKG